MNNDGEVGEGTTAGQTCGSGLFGHDTCEPAPVQVIALDTTVAEVAAGGPSGGGLGGATCARKQDGTLWCWGPSDLGELGDGTTGGQSCGVDYPSICEPSPMQVLACP